MRTLLFVGLALALSCATAQPPRSVAVPLIIEKNRPYVDVTFTRPDGSTRVARMLLDTGGGGFLIGEPLARDLGLTWGATMKEEGAEFGRSENTPSVSVGGFALRLTPERVLVLVGQKGPLSRIGIEAEGMIPGHVLSQYHVIFDYPAATLSIGDAGAFVPRGDSLPMPIGRTGFPRTEIVVEGQTYGLLLDTGASFTMVSDVLLKKLGAAHPQWKRYPGAYGEAATLGGQTIETMFVPDGKWGPHAIGEFGITSQREGTFERYMSNMMTAPIIGSLAGNVLTQFRVELDYPRKKLYLSKPAARSGTDDWVTARPEAAGVDTAVLREHRELCDRSAADACLVVRNGVLVDEWYGPKYQAPVGAMSSTKSIAGLLVGLLIADGKMKLDDPVSKFIPEWKAGSEAGVTIRHLLTMTSGLPDDRKSGEANVGFVLDKDSLVFTLPVRHRPGTVWNYSNNGTHLLSPIIERAAGEPVNDYARKRLFEPLGMHTTKLYEYPDGQTWLHAEMRTTPREFARIGQMMLSGGRWGGRQVVPEAWVRASTTPSQGMEQYGYLWWLNVTDGFAARGYLDTNLYVIPKSGLVVVRMQSKPASGAAAYDRAAQRLFARMVH